MAVGDTSMANVMEPDEAATAQVYRWAYRFLQNHHDAQDATQEVLTRWIQRRALVVENRTAWLRRTTINCCIDAIRARSRPAPQPDAPDNVVVPAAAAAQRELRERIATSLASLSDQQRTVVVAKLYDRETFASIAAAMNLSVSTVKTHYLRALRAMRGALKDFAEVRI